MRTLKMTLAVLALLALLAGCGAVGEPETQPATTEHAGITEAETTTEAPPADLAQDSNKSVSWRELDLFDEANAAIRKELEQQLAQNAYTGQDEYRLSDSKTLFYKASGEMGGKAIWLRDAQSGEEKKLIDPNQEDKHFTAYIQNVLSERYFIYLTARMESDGGWGGRIFDVQRNKTIPIAYPYNRHADFYFAQDGILYYYAIEEEYFTPIYVYSLYLKDFDAAETLAFGEDLLRDVPEAHEVVEIQTLLYAPGAHYFVVAEGAGGDTIALRVFDLQKQSFVARVPVEGRHIFRAAMLGDKLYCYDVDWETDNPSSCKVDRYALEITLP